MAAILDELDPPLSLSLPFVSECAGCGEAILDEDEVGYDAWDRLVHVRCRSFYRCTDTPNCELLNSSYDRRGRS